MALKTILNRQEDFTGEFPKEYATSGLWRFNDEAWDENGLLTDSSGQNRKLEVVNRIGVTAGLVSSGLGGSIKINLNDPANEKLYLKPPMTARSFRTSATPCGRRLDDADHILRRQHLLSAL